MKIERESIAYQILKDFLNVRSVITLTAFFCLYFLILSEKKVPDILIAFVNLLQGFWFGQKYSQIQQKQKGIENNENLG